MPSNRPPQIEYLLRDIGRIRTHFSEPQYPFAISPIVSGLGAVQAVRERKRQRRREMKQ